jgi:hypothetical protein
MKDSRLEIRLSKKEKKQLEQICNKHGLTLSEYLRKKVFDENEDMIFDDDKYVSPIPTKHNLLAITAIYKMYHLVLSTLKSQGLSVDEISTMDKKSLDYAREERLKHGYKVIKNE